MVVTKELIRNTGPNPALLYENMHFNKRPVSHMHIKFEKSLIWESVSSLGRREENHHSRGCILSDNSRKIKTNERGQKKGSRRDVQPISQLLGQYIFDDKEN